jgi:hypothetical protein
LGNPAQKLSWREGVKELWQGPDNPETAFDYDEESYWVQSRAIHGTTVMVAIHKSLAERTSLQGHRLPAPQEFADFMFKGFDLHWHRFGGFPYDRYTVKVKSPSDTPNWSLSRVGITLGSTAGEGSPGSNYPPHHYASGLYEIFGIHEMLHSWNGKLITYQPSGDGRVFQLETWVAEGITGYWGNQTLGAIRGVPQYQAEMRRMWEQYQRLWGTQFDLSVEELTHRIGSPGMGPPAFTEYYAMLTARIELFSYLLDLELSKTGHHLEDLMRRLYEDFGLKGRLWKQADVLTVLQELTSSSWDEFFATYLLTNARLPLDGSFRYLGP